MQSANICLINGNHHKFEFGYVNVFVPMDHPDGCEPLKTGRFGGILMKGDGKL